MIKKKDIDITNRFRNKVQRTMFVEQQKVF